MLAVIPLSSLLTLSLGTLSYELRLWFTRNLNTTFNNISVISWWPVLLVEKTGVTGENQRTAASLLTNFIT